MLNREAKREDQADGHPLEPWKFGSPARDPVEYGRRGGIASGQVRRERPVRELEKKITGTKNGAAIYGLYRIELQRQQERERERVKLDSEIVDLYEEREEVRAQVDELKDERDRARTARAALVRRLELLHTSVGAEQHELVDRLRVLHEAGGLEAALEELGLLERVDES